MHIHSFLICQRMSLIRPKIFIRFAFLSTSVKRFQLRWEITVWYVFKHYKEPHVRRWVEDCANILRMCSWKSEKLTSKFFAEIKYLEDQTFLCFLRSNLWRIELSANLPMIEITFECSKSLILYQLKSNKIHFCPQD